MILSIRKPVGWTSFDVVKKVRNITREKKVGHAGTLDPFAEGLLVIGTGADTKNLAAIADTEKTYEAVLQLGQSTDSHDSTGQVTAEQAIPGLTEAEITAALQSFQGPQDQIPPMHSAKKVAGKRLYQLARQNITIDREPARITIHAIELIDWRNDKIEFRTTCSKGTYIRVLGADIASRLGTIGHLTRLVRTRIGNYSLKDALSIEAFEEQWKSIAA
ncbi:MAG: tRNA pseudouridine(55) synthase TruB [Candidatus Neomarinimicrobiota bacterium]